MNVWLSDEEMNQAGADGRVLQTLHELRRGAVALIASFLYN